MRQTLCLIFLVVGVVLTYHIKCMEASSRQMSAAMFEADDLCTELTLQEVIRSEAEQDELDAAFAGADASPSEP